ncbi:GFA family protein [Pelagibius sp.]|uniref:GFA family protein n=1 Tax=Pelagibius sp. TaxID=1931238 RepID=UPI0026387CBB|nr:GFA family protein [Pelagibius sp.]
MTEGNAHLLEGGCACGAVRYRMTAEPLFVHCCHCRWCQRETGSAFVLNALIEATEVEVLKGAPEFVPTPSESGRGQQIARCPTCRVALWSHYAGAGAAISFLRVGTLDAPDRVAPDVHIYTDSKQPWVTLPEGVPAFPGYYRAQEIWPAESQARYRAAIKSA